MCEASVLAEDGRWVHGGPRQRVQHCGGLKQVGGVLQGASVCGGHGDGCVQSESSSVCADQLMSNIVAQKKTVVEVVVVVVAAPATITLTTAAKAIVNVER